VIRFMVTPATRTMTCFHNEAFWKARGSSEFSSSPSSRTKPPIGSQFSVYSVSWSCPMILALGGKPSPNSRTRMPTSLAVMKWPSSCSSTSGTRMSSSPTMEISEN